MRSEPKLGDRAKHDLTGFSGIVVCVTDWLKGRRRIGIKSEEVKDGKIGRGINLTDLDVHYFDAAQCSVVQENVHTAGSEPRHEPPGGPDRGEEQR